MRRGQVGSPEATMCPSPNVGSARNAPKFYGRLRSQTRDLRHANSKIYYSAHTLFLNLNFLHNYLKFNLM